MLHDSIFCQALQDAALICKLVLFIVPEHLYDTGTNKIKEEFSMKAAALRRRIVRFNTYIPYPNAATGRQILQKVLDMILMAACGMGIAAVFLFMMVLL